SITPFSSTTYTSNANNSLIDLGDTGTGGYSSPPSKNPFQTQTLNSTNTAKPTSLKDLARTQISNQQASPFQNQNNPGGY
ncbi:14876_t:CDS:1, partial [Funneliformis caledonium]